MVSNSNGINFNFKSATIIIVYDLVSNSNGINFNTKTKRKLKKAKRSFKFQRNKF